MENRDLTDEIVALILRVAAELRDDGELQYEGEVSADTRLFGREGLLDSIGLVRLIIEVEQALEDELGKPLSLADEKALSLKSSPYRTVGTLAEYARTQL